MVTLVQATGVLLVAVNLVVSGAPHSQDKTEPGGLPKSGIPDIKINAQIPDVIALDLARPYYSADVHVVGAVRVWVKIDKAGDVVAARAISGHPLLKPSALQAAVKSKFEPKSALGSRFVIGNITYTFTFPDDNAADLPALAGHRVTLRGQFSMRGSDRTSFADWTGAAAEASNMKRTEAIDLMKNASHRYARETRPIMHHDSLVRPVSI